MTTKPDNLAQVFHFDLYGKREAKYDFLNQNSLQSIEWNKLQPEAPNFFLVKKDFDQSGMYELGFKVDELFKINNTGIETGRDDFFIDWNKSLLKAKVKNVLYNKDNVSILNSYKIVDTESFRFREKIINSNFDESKIIKILYRPFDIRYTYYDTSLQRRASYSTVKHLMKPNIALTICRQQSTFDFQHILATTCITERCTVSLQTKETGNVFPLYLYPEANATDLFAETERTPNLNQAIVDKIAEGLGLKFTNEKSPSTGGVGEASFAPIDIMDYIYAVLHSPTYREKYKEFLKIDFPRVPYPKSYKVFENLIGLGSQLRQIHLLESPIVEKYITQYPIDGDNVVVKISTAPQPPEGEFLDVYINESQYFKGVPAVAWNFYIGGYQPAQKWLKDRKERELSFEDILHYQKIIVALTQTNAIMAKIDAIDIEGNQSSE